MDIDEYDTPLAPDIPDDHAMETDPGMEVEEPLVQSPHVYNMDVPLDAGISTPLGYAMTESGHAVDIDPPETDEMGLSEEGVETVQAVGVEGVEEGDRDGTRGNLGVVSGAEHTGTGADREGEFEEEGVERGEGVGEGVVEGAEGDEGDEGVEGDEAEVEVGDEAKGVGEERDNLHHDEHEYNDHLSAASANPADLIYPTGPADPSTSPTDEYPTDARTMPPFIIYLPKLGARSLFHPLPDAALPVWLSSRLDELGEAALSDVWLEIKNEVANEGLAQNGEMILTEKQMELKMGEDDVHLQSVTLLDLAQVHYGCGLPGPVQLYVTFEPHRFITRFNAIQKEVQAQIQLEEEGEGGDEDEDDEIEDGDDGGDGDTQIDDPEDAEHGTTRVRPPRVDSEHPLADWANSRVVHPVQTQGDRISLPTEVALETTERRDLDSSSTMPASPSAIYDPNDPSSVPRDEIAMNEAERVDVPSPGLTMVHETVLVTPVDRSTEYEDASDTEDEEYEEDGLDGGLEEGSGFYDVSTRADENDAAASNEAVLSALDPAVQVDEAKEVNEQVHGEEDEIEANGEEADADEADEEEMDEDETDHDEADEDDTEALDIAGVPGDETVAKEGDGVDRDEAEAHEDDGVNDDDYEENEEVAAEEDITNLDTARTHGDVAEADEAVANTNAELAEANEQIAEAAELEVRAAELETAEIVAPAEDLDADADGDDDSYDGVDQVIAAAEKESLTTTSDPTLPVSPRTPLSVTDSKRPRDDDESDTVASKKPRE